MAQRVTVTGGGGGTPVIVSATDGDILQMQNVSDLAIEYANAPIDTNDPTKRGFMLYPGAITTISGAISRQAIYATHQGSGSKQLVFQRF